MLKNRFHFVRKESFNSFLAANTNRTVVYLFLLLLYILLFFQPFGLDKIPITLLIIVSLGYSTMIVLGYGLSVSILRSLKVKKWNKFYEFFTYTNCLIFIWLLTYSYAIFSYEFLYPQWGSPGGQIIVQDYFFFKSCRYVLGIGYLTYALIQIYHSFYSRESRNSENVKQANQQPIDNFEISNTESITIIGKNENENITLNLDSFICINSKGHYLDIFFLCEKSHTLKRKTFRNSLKNIEFQLSNFPSLYRCHNSYIISINLLESVYGNAHQAYAKIMYYPEKIPISYNKINFMKDVLKQKRNLINIA